MMISKTCSNTFLKVAFAALLSCTLPVSAFAQNGGGGLICPPVEVVFTVDTSGSMNDEAAALCSSISAVESGLLSAGVSASSFLWGITENGAQAGSDFACLTDSVANALGTAVPGTENGICGTTLSDSESWGEAISIVSANFPWTSGAVRIIVPISDEGACDGGSGDCTPPSDDLDALTNATTLALANNVFVSPIAGTGSSQCVKDQGQDMATATGGEWFESTDPQLDLVSAVNDLILSACVASNNPPTAICQDVTVNADENCQGEASVDNGSFDQEGGAVTLSQDPAGPYPLGTTQVTLTVTDNGGLQDSCTATVTVLETKDDGTSCLGTPDLEVECAEVNISSTLFTLDGNARQQRRIVNRLVRLAVKNGGKRKRARAIRNDAQATFTDSWTTIWKNPVASLSCEQSAACTVSSLNDVIGETIDKLDEGFDVTQRAAKFLNQQVAGNSLPAFGRRLVRRGAQLLQSSKNDVSSLPTQQTTCDTESVTVVLSS